MYNILLVEDNEDIQDINKYFLEKQGYGVKLAMNLTQARNRIALNTPDLIVLDIMLPDGSGLDFLQELRELGNDTPVLLLTALSEISDEIKAIQQGGDDYITKPYENEVLLTRIDALLRRAGRVPQIIKKGTLTLEAFSGQAFIGDESLGLTTREFNLLLLLVQNESRLLAVDFIYEKVWAQPMHEDKSAVQTIVSRLRKKIETSGYYIDMVRGKGYIFTKF